MKKILRSASIAILGVMLVGGVIYADHSTDARAYRGEPCDITYGELYDLDFYQDRTGDWHPQCVARLPHHLVRSTDSHITRGFMAYWDRETQTDVYRYWVEDDGERYEVTKEVYDSHD